MVVYSFLYQLNYIIPYTTEIVSVSNLHGSIIRISLSNTEVILKSDHQSVWCFILTINGNNVFECGVCLP